MSRYFISWGSGHLDAGNPVIWKWDDVGAQLTITPQEVETNRSVSFLWSASGTETRVVIQLDQDGADETVVKVSDSGWPRDAQGTARCLEAMQGWMHMLCCLKAYLEYGINLRSVGVNELKKAMRKNDEPVVVEQTYNTSINAVWSSITEIDQMRQWYFENIPSFKPEVGFETQFNVENEGRNFLHIWKVTEVVPKKK